MRAFFEEWFGLQRSIAVENGITEGVIWKQLLIFFFPILFGTFFQQLYNTADAVIVGQFVGKEALAAVGGPTSVLINLLVNLLVGISSGTTIVIAQFYGGQRYDDVQQAVHSSVALALTAGAGMMFLGLLLTPWALQAMGTPPEIVADSLIYMQVYLFGMIPSFLYNVGSGILRAVGDTRRPLYFLIAACLTNILLDLLFVVYFRMGVFGVALATVISQVVSAVLVIAALMRAEYPCRLVRQEIRFTAESVKAILRVGLPAGLQSDMYAISNILLQSCMNSFGTDAIAAWSAFGKIDGFFWMITSAYGVAVTTFVGQNFGAQKYPRIRKSVRICLGMSFGTAIVCGALITGFAAPLLRLFTSDQNVLEIGGQMIWMLAPYYFTYVSVEILAGAIRGTGESLIPMLMTCFGVCVLRVIWVFFVLPLDWQLDTLLVSYPITWAATAVLFILYYIQGGWLRRRILKCGFEPEIRSR